MMTKQGALCLHQNINRKEVHTTEHKCRPHQVIGNVETGLFLLFLLEKIIYLNQQIVYRIVEEKDISKYSIYRERKGYRRVHGSQ